VTEIELSASFCIVEKVVAFSCRCESFCGKTEHNHGSECLCGLVMSLIHRSLVQIQSQLDEKLLKMVVV